MTRSPRKKAESGAPPRILTVDIGGSHVKLLLSGLDVTQARRFDSGPDLTPAEMVRGVLERLQELGAVTARELHGEPESMVFALPKELRLQLVG